MQRKKSSVQLIIGFEVLFAEFRSVSVFVLGVMLGVSVGKGGGGDLLHFLGYFALVHCHIFFFVYLFFC